jgi:predicted  nucleic acid-binding Zn-ribbon protein
LGGERDKWRQREAELRDEIQRSLHDKNANEKQKEDADRQVSELRLLIGQKEEDIKRSKERSDKAIEALESQLASESKTR